MKLSKIEMQEVPGRFAICRIASQLSIPYWATQSSFLSVTRSADEFSIVAEEKLVPPNVEADKGWRAMRVAGELNFALTGVLSSIAGILAEAKISIFAVSTFKTDYVLVKAESFDQAMSLLKKLA